MAVNAGPHVRYCCLLLLLQSSACCCASAARLDSPRLERRRQEDLIVNSIPILLVGLAGGILTSLQIWLRPYSDLFFVFLEVIEICVQSAAIDVIEI